MHGQGGCATSGPPDGTASPDAPFPAPGGVTPGAAGSGAMPVPAPAVSGAAPALLVTAPGFSQAPVLDLRTGAGRPPGADDSARAADATAAPVDGEPGPPVPHEPPVRHELRYPAGDIVVFSGLPGSGKSTVMGRAVPGTVHRLDSQDARERWGRRLPRLPYGVYRPLARAAHYTALWRALRTGDSVVVHDCGSLPWVRRWLAREARRSGRELHLLLLDVPARDALAGQAARGRRVSRYAFRRHLRSVRRLVARAEAASPPSGCSTVVLLDRGAAEALHAIRFGDADPRTQPVSPRRP